MAGAGGKSQGAGTGSLALNASFCSALSVWEVFCTLKTSLLYSSLIKCNRSVASDIRVRNATSTYIYAFRGSLSTKQQLEFTFEFVIDKDCASPLWCILSVSRTSFSRCLSSVTVSYKPILWNKMEGASPRAPTWESVLLSKPMPSHPAYSLSPRVYWAVPFVSLLSLSTMDNPSGVPVQSSLGLYL